MTIAGKDSVEMPKGTQNSVLKQSGLKDKSGKVMRYMIVIEKGDNSFGAYVPDLPGCVAVGETEEEVRQLIHEAIELHLEDLQESGKEIPQPQSKSEYIEVLAA